MCLLTKNVRIHKSRFRFLEVQGGEHNEYHKHVNALLATYKP